MDQNGKYILLDLDNVLVGRQKKFLKAGQIIIEQLKTQRHFKYCSLRIVFLITNFQIVHLVYKSVPCVQKCTLCAATRSCFSRSVFPSSALSSRSPRVCKSVY